MALLDALRYRFRSVWRRSTFDREIDEELRFHLSRGISDRSHGGLEPAAAHRAAARDLGNTTYMKEELRRATLLRAIDATRQDARFAFRTLARSPVFTAVTIVTLAVGIGLNSAIFSLMYSVLFAKLPVAHAKDLVQVQVAGQGIADQFTLAQYREMRGAVESPVSELAAFSQTVARVQAGNLEDYVGIDLISDNYFPALGLRTARGRPLTSDDGHAAAPVVVISDGLWGRFFNRDPAAIGSTLSIGGIPFVIVGVTPPAFRGIGFPAQFAAAIAMQAAPLIAPMQSGEDQRTVRLFARMARRESEASVAQALETAFRTCCAANAGPLAVAGKGAHITVRSISQGIPSAKEDIRGEYRRILALLMCGVGALLLITCVNVANLLMSRGMSRRREFSTRLALGASRGRLVRQCLVESVLLAGVGGVCALAIAALALQLLASQLSAETGGSLGALIGFHASAPVLGFTAAISLCTGVLFGLLPAVRSTGLDVAGALREANHASPGRADGALRHAFVVAQFAFSLALVIVAGLFARSLRNLRNDHLGFEASHVLAVQVDARGTSYQGRPLVPLYDEIVKRARSLPAVRRAGLSSYAPAFGGLNLTSSVTVAGRVPLTGEEPPQFNYISSEFFGAIGATMALGRAFSEQEGHGQAHVAVVNQAFAHKYFGSLSPIGRQIQIPEDVTILGVVHDVQFDGPGSHPGPMVFLPYSQWPADWHYLTLTVRTTAPPEQLAPSVRAMLRETAPGIRVQRLTTLEDQVNRVLERQRFAAWLSAIFGIAALCLVAVGLYGVVSYLASARTTEFGIRVALGADGRALLWLVLRDSLVLSAAGVAIGLPAALATARFAASQLYRVGAADPATILGAALLLLVISALATLLPAAKASRTDPVVALRAD